MVWSALNHPLFLPSSSQNKLGIYMLPKIWCKRICLLCFVDDRLNFVSLSAVRFGDLLLWKLMLCCSTGCLVQGQRISRDFCCCCSFGALVWVGYAHASWFCVFVYWFCYSSYHLLWKVCIEKDGCRNMGMRIVVGYASCQF
jgi:hypothetical protein